MHRRHDSHPSRWVLIGAPAIGLTSATLIYRTDVAHTDDARTGRTRVARLLSGDAGSAAWLPDPAADLARPYAANTSVDARPTIQASIGLAAGLPGGTAGRARRHSHEAGRLGCRAGHEVAARFGHIAARRACPGLAGPVGARAGQTDQRGRAGRGRWSGARQSICAAQAGNTAAPVVANVGGTARLSRVSAASGSVSTGIGRTRVVQRGGPTAGAAIDAARDPSAELCDVAHAGTLSYAGRRHGAVGSPLVDERLIRVAGRHITHARKDVGSEGRDLVELENEVELPHAVDRRAISRRLVAVGTVGGQDRASERSCGVARGGDDI